MCFAERLWYLASSMTTSCFANDPIVRCDSVLANIQRTDVYGQTPVERRTVVVDWLPSSV
jgi:hypothetical protein